MPKVSIILPTYNGARYLRQSIESCLNQTHRDIELIVVDDCSTDGSASILEAYAGRNNVRLIRHGSNKKLPAALNTGFALATGALLTWTSDDNYFAPDAVERMTGYLEKHPDTPFVYTDCWIVDADGQVVRRKEAGPPEHLREGCAITCFLYRREVYEATGEYDSELFRIEDYDYWLRIMKHFRMGWLPEPVYYYRRHSASLTGTDAWKNRIRMMDLVQTRHFGPDPGRASRLAAKYLVAEAFESHAQGKRLDVLKYLLRAVGSDRALLGNRGVCSIALQALAGKATFEFLRRLNPCRSRV